MDDEAKTIRVSGLPVDISENRLVDKIQIHFLRKKNGGGEISSVNVSKAMPGTAFVTFEESEVAWRLAQKEKQIFKVSDKSYVITIRLHSKEVDADEVLLSMSVVVDHRRLPGGKDALFSLHKSVPGVYLAYDFQKELYTLKGRYSEVQTLSSLVLESLAKQHMSSGDKPQTERAAIEMYDSHLPPMKSASNQVEEASGDTGVAKHTHLSEELDVDEEDKSWIKGLHLPSSSSDQASHVALAEKKWDSDIDSLFEDFSLLVDSDIFRYLHQYCSKEYQGILGKHQVEVLDVNCDDITTLYIKPKTAPSPHDMSSVLKAHEDLAHLYQQKQSQLRKEHVCKPGIPETELTHALASLRERLPSLMIREDDKMVYMIGSKSDVSEAKQFISDMFSPPHFKRALSKQGSACSQDLFMPKQDQDVNQGWLSGATSGVKGHRSVKLKSEEETIRKTADDIFDYRRTDVSQEKHVSRDPEWLETGLWLDKNKHTDSLLDSFKPSASHSVMDTDKKLFRKLDFTTGKKVNPETPVKSSKGYKAKQTETGKERKMAASFTREHYNGTKYTTSHKADAPQINEGVDVGKRNIADSEQPHSLPVIKTSLTTHLNVNAVRGSASAQTSTSDKMLKTPYDKKPTVTVAGLGGEQTPKSFPTAPLESARRRTNSFSGKIKKGTEPVQMAVDICAGHNGTTHNSERRETVEMNLVLSFRLWLYLTSVYNAEIENLTTDLQVKESLHEEDIVLCLRGVDSKKLSECHRGLKSLIATAEVDFDARTLPLSELGVSDSKNQILIELCTLLKQRYKTVKILVMSNDVMILGPKTLGEEVEVTIIKVFHEQANSKLEKTPSHPDPDGLHNSEAPKQEFELLSDQPTTSAHRHTDISVTDLSNVSDQSVACSTNQTVDSRGQGHQTRRVNSMQEEKLKRLDQKDPSDGATVNVEKGETRTGGVVKTAAMQNEASGQLMGQMCVLTDQIGDLEGTHGSSDPNNDVAALHASGYRNLRLCCVCGKEHIDVRQAACGCNCCPECEEAHDNCALCKVAGIKGSMTVQESTITIPGFNRDTTLKIIYEIPDGVQAEHHPHPGAPFKGSRFEAFLPHNKTTRQLLPLLEKAFHRGLTFTVKLGSPDNDEGQVVWGSIPHKTRTEGGASQNGYPDFNYIKRLEEALNAVGVGE